VCVSVSVLCSWLSYCSCFWHYGSYSRHALVLMVYENDSCSSVLCLQLLSSVPTSSRRACRYGALFHPLSAECYTTPHDSAVWSTLLHQGWPHFFLLSCILELFLELLLSSQCYDGVVLAIAVCLCVLQVTVLSEHLNGSCWFFGTETSFDISCTVFEENSVPSKTKVLFSGTSS